jgi:hypothetical protein
MIYFTPSEIKYYDRMSPKLLTALDMFRERCNAPVYVSPAEGATWRPRHKGSHSYHSCIPGRNKQSWAIDVFPTCDPWEAFLAATSVPEINGIGLYPHWQFNSLKFGMHLDIRHDPRVVWWEPTDHVYRTIHSFKHLEQLIKEFD